MNVAAGTAPHLAAKAQSPQKEYQILQYEFSIHVDDLGHDFSAVESSMDQSEKSFDLYIKKFKEAINQMNTVNYLK